MHQRNIEMRKILLTKQQLRGKQYVMAIRKQDWMQTWVSLIHASTYLRHGLEQALRAELGFGLSEQDLIKQLHVNGGALTLTELSRRIYFSKAGITRMLDRLEQAGLVQRQKVEGDRRSLSAVLTPAGEDAFARSRDLLGRYVKAALHDKLTDDELLGLKDILESLLAAHGVFEGQQRHLKGGPEARS